MMAHDHVTDTAGIRTRQTAAIRVAAHGVGFELVGITPAVTPAGFPRLVEWIAQGCHGTMDYIPRRIDAYRDPGRVLPGARSVIALAINHNPQSPSDTPSGGKTGQQDQVAITPSHRSAGECSSGAASQAATPGARIARYAQPVRDYHEVIRPRLRRLVGDIATIIPGAKARGVIDTAPVLERDFATQAGLGWIGKNTMLINKRLGSWLFLAAILVNAELDYDEPHHTSHCGTCTRCLEVCPTQAFTAPYMLDARRCISYLTIESRDLPPEELRQGMGDWLFGCDLCQEVCPWNRRAPQATTPDFLPVPELASLDPRRLLRLSEAEFEAAFAPTPLARPGWWGLRRNALVVLGNTGTPADLSLLESLPSEPSLQPLITWAINTITSRYPPAND